MPWKLVMPWACSKLSGCGDDGGEALPSSAVVRRSFLAKRRIGGPFPDFIGRSNEGGGSKSVCCERVYRLRQVATKVRLGVQVDVHHFKSDRTNVGAHLSDFSLAGTSRRLRWTGQGTGAGKNDEQGV